MAAPLSRCIISSDALLYGQPATLSQYGWALAITHNAKADTLIVRQYV